MQHAGMENGLGHMTRLTTSCLVCKKLGTAHAYLYMFCCMCESAWSLFRLSRHVQKENTKELLDAWKCKETRILTVSVSKSKCQEVHE